MPTTVWWCSHIELFACWMCILGRFFIFYFIDKKNHIIMIISNNSSSILQLSWSNLILLNFFINSLI